MSRPFVQGAKSGCCDAAIVANPHGFHCSQCGMPVYQTPPDD